MLSSQPGDEAYQTYAFEETELDATIKSTATLNIDILLEGKPVRARIRWQRGCIFYPGARVITLQ